MSALRIGRWARSRSFRGPSVGGVGATSNGFRYWEAFAPGACVSEVARRHEISMGQLYTSRSKLAAGTATPAPDDSAVAGFAAVVVDGGEPPLPGSGTAIIVDLPRGRQMTIFPGASAVFVAAAPRRCGDPTWRAGVDRPRLEHASARTSAPVKSARSLAAAAKELGESK